MYTESDLRKVKKAILDLVSGKRVVSVAINDRTIRYGQAELPHLREVLADVQNHLSKKQGKSRYALIQSTKGL